jgi:hypothetical protein
MMKRRLLLVAAIAALIVPAAAQAKGPDQARISGPGLDKTIVLSGMGEDGTGPLGELTMNAGFFQTMFGQTPDTRLAHRPSGNLGARYKVVYRVPGPNGNSFVRQDLYPYANGGAVTYMRPGQHFWGTQRTVGGWYRATTTVKPALVHAGLPRTPSLPSGGGGGSSHGWLIAGIALAVLAAAALALTRVPSVRRRLRPLPGT